MRQADEFPSDGEAALGSVSGLGGAGLAPSAGGFAGLGRNKNASSRKHDVVMEFYGLPPIGQKQERPMDGAQFHSPKVGEAGGELHREQRADGRSSSSGVRGNSSPESAQESVENAQHSGDDGVEEDMATLVLDNSVLDRSVSGSSTRGAGAASRPDSRPNALAEGLDPASDAAIMLRVAAGDEASFNYLAQKYHRAMIHFLFRMVRNQAIAEELAQEVFLRVYRSRESYRAEAKFTTWLYRIATNLAVNHARDTRHERAAQTLYLDAPDEETGTTPDVADDELSVEQRLMRDERMGAIRTHVMALPERQRMAVLMHKYQGMDYRQIGEVLKLSESATKSLLFRAYQTLRDKLKDFV